MAFRALNYIKYIQLFVRQTHTHTHTHTQRDMHTHTLVRPLSWPAAQTEALKHSLLKISLALSVDDVQKLQPHTNDAIRQLPPLPFLLFPLGS